MQLLITSLIFTISLLLTTVIEILVLPLTIIASACLMTDEILTDIQNHKDKGDGK
jgi:hypothetical protein